MATDSSGDWINPDSASSGGSQNPMAMFGIAAAGLGLQAFGAYKGYESSQSAKTYNAAQTSQIGHEQQLEDQKYQAMLLMNDRQQKQNLRNVQRARSISVAQAVGSGQGAGSFSGSGLSGSLGAESAQGGINALGLSQNLQVGQSMYGIHKNISSDKINMANAQLEMQMKKQEGDAWGSLGKSLMSAAPAIAMFL